MKVYLAALPLDVLQIVEQNGESLLVDEGLLVEVREKPRLAILLERPRRAIFLPSHQIRDCGVILEESVR